jgi:hypothetical protein
MADGSVTPLDRFMAKVDRSGECWIWTGSVFDTGYGQFRGAGRSSALAHRFAYEAFKEPLPGGYEPDHICHNEDLACLGGWSCPHRRCVNPAHLEAVTHAENMRRLRERRQHQLLAGLCPQGLHLMVGKNVYIVPSTGALKCRECVHASHRKWRAANPRRPGVVPVTIT